MENYYAKLRPASLSFPSLVMYICSGASPMWIVLAFEWRKLSASISSKDKHLISRSPGIKSFLVASNRRLERLNSTGSVAKTICLESSKGYSKRDSRLGCLSFVSCYGSFFRMLNISSLYGSLNFFLSTACLSKMKREQSMLFLSFFFAL